MLLRNLEEMLLRKSLISVSKIKPEAATANLFYLKTSEHSHQFHLKDPGHLLWLTRLWRRSASSWYAASCCFHCFTLAVDSSRAAVSLALLPLSVASSASQCLLIVELHRQNENGQNSQISSFMLLKCLINFLLISSKKRIIQRII